MLKNIEYAGSELFNLFINWVIIFTIRIVIVLLKEN